jgi:hypothetical protein
MYQFFSKNVALLSCGELVIACSMFLLLGFVTAYMIPTTNLCFAFNHTIANYFFLIPFLQLVTL